ncbi:uncharacterized protein TFAM [Epargyreus clarus]|uniref:uncharacterized protein TFAM n=1 Tax=Epargyreus clarus TaxID=520877 RepID=UPI003C2AE950
MSFLSQFTRLSSNIGRSYRNALSNSSNVLIPVQIQTINYTKKSAEEKLGIEKPKRPLNPFFRFMTQMTPSLLTKVPGISTKEAIVWSSKHWQQLDSETKLQMKKEYEKDWEEYKKMKAVYEASLTEQQKADIKRTNEEMVSAKQRRKLKIEYKEMGKPKKPMSSYILYTQSRKDVLPSRQLKEYQDKVKSDWLNLPHSERGKFEKQAQDLMKKYHKDMDAWEMKMISMGHLHLVRKKSPRKAKVKIDKEKYQMASLTYVFRLSNHLLGGYRNVFHGRTNWLPPILQTCGYTRKSPEEKLGIDKPKRPLTPFFKFMTQMRPALLAKNPGITSKEAIAWSSKHWQQLDSETKSQMHKEYEKDLEDYKKIKAMYEASLTEQQKADIKQVKEDMVVAREKRKLKAELKEMGKPKKPMSSYFLYAQSKKDLMQSGNMKEFQQKVKTDWLKLPESEKTKYEKEAQDLMNKYKKDIQAWELKMISIGRTDLVRQKPPRTKTVKTQ